MAAEAALADTAPWHDDVYIDAGEAADLTGLARGTLIKMAVRGEIFGYKPGGRTTARWRLRANSLLAYLRAQDSDMGVSAARIERYLRLRHDGAS